MKSEAVRPIWAVDQQLDVLTNAEINLKSTTLGGHRGLVRVCKIRHTHQTCPVNFVKCPGKVFDLTG